MKKFDYDTVKERLNNRLKSQIKLSKDYEFLDYVDGLDEFHACVNEYIVRVDKRELIKK